MQAAHDAAAALAEELLTAENANLPADQQTRISVVTFGVKAELAQGYSTNAEDISKAVPTKAKYFEGTNWEAALILANDQLANKQLGARENAEKHVIFLSDGDPTLRMSAEGFGESGIEWNLFDGKNLDGTYGTRVDDPNGRNLSAATRVAKGRPASSMYVVNTSKSAKKMGTFAEKTGARSSMALLKITLLLLSLRLVRLLGSLLAIRTLRLPISSRRGSSLFRPMMALSETSAIPKTVTTGLMLMPLPQRSTETRSRGILARSIRAQPIL